jgi:molybdopterin molybdotransferase
MDMLQVADVEDARDRVIGLYPHLPLKTEKITLMKAVGRVLAQNVYADISIPSFDRSTVDGYAVRSADTAGAGESIPVFLRQIGKVEMGIPAGLTLKDGECAYIPTGGMLPENCDAVVMVEYCESFMQGQVAVSKAC